MSTKGNLALVHRRALLGLERRPAGLGHGGIAWGLVIGGMPVYPGIWHLMAGRWVEGGVITGVGVLIVLAVSLGNWWVERKAS